MGVGAVSCNWYTADERRKYLAINKALHGRKKGTMCNCSGFTMNTCRLRRVVKKTSRPFL